MGRWFCAARGLFGMEVVCAAITAGVQKESGWTLPTGWTAQNAGSTPAFVSKLPPRAPARSPGDLAHAGQDLWRYTGSKSRQTVEPEKFKYPKH